MSVASVRFTPVSPIPVTGDIRAQAVRQLDTQPEKKVKPQLIQSAAADLQRMSHAFNKKIAICG
jgi:hypothetical protein